MELIFILLFFGIVCAVIAPSKNRSSTGWFFGGFFLALIGLIILLALPAKEEEFPGENEKYCPYCSEIIHKDAIKCKHCHEYLEDIPGKR